MRPHLFFLTPVNTEQDKQSGFPPAQVVYPPISTRNKWFEQQVERLKQSLHQSTLTDSPSTADPKKVLVIKTIGNCDELITALAKLSNNEFLASQFWDHIEANEDFYFADNKDKTIPVQMYLSMANITAVERLERLWRQYSDDQQMDFPYGLAGLKKVFNLLEEIRFWNEDDRLYHSELIKQWQFQQAYQPEQQFRVEIELWFRRDKIQRQQHQRNIAALIEASGGQVLQVVCIPEIQYHAILAFLTPADAELIIQKADRKPKYVYYDGIKTFQPCGQSMVAQQDLDNLEADNTPLDKTITTQLPPQIALLDGLPLANHCLLTGRLDITSTDISSTYKTGEQVHGTAMASTILHGDLGKDIPLNQQLHSVAIMQPDLLAKTDENRQECIPFDQLPIQMVYQAVLKMKVGTLDSPPTAPHIKIVNLSVCDDYRLYDNTMSAWARLLDWLSIKFNLLFLVSVGNHAMPIALEEIEHTVSLNTVDDILLEEQTLIGIQKTRYRRRLMSPSESVNALSVGALHDDNSGRFDDRFQRDPYLTQKLPSPVNSVTSGAKRSVKPELMLPGGRQTYQKDVSADSGKLEIMPTQSFKKPGIKVAMPSKTEGKINTVGYGCGTSFATALATHHAGHLLEMLNTYRDHNNVVIDEENLPVLIKALLVHAGEDDKSSRVLIKTLNDSHQSESQLYHHFYGYGLHNSKRVKGCQSNQATLIYTGSLYTGSSKQFTFPLPPALDLTATHKRFILTLAWHSRTQPSNQQKYRRTKLHFDFSLQSEQAKSLLALQSRQHDHHAIRNGTVQHEVFSGDKAAVFDGETLISITVNAFDTAKHEYEVPFAFVVTLDAPGTSLPIYEEVKAQLDVMVKQQVAKVL